MRIRVNQTVAFLGALALAGVMSSYAAAAIQTGDQVSINRDPGGPDPAYGFANTDRTFGSASGGEFKVTKVGDASSVLKSFCLERQEFISLPGTYWATIESKSLAGGAGYASPSLPYLPGSALPAGVGDPISTATSWLFGSYVNNALGALTNGDAFGGGGANGSFVYDNDSWVNALQDAIWYLEEELGALGAGTFNGLSQAARQLVNSANANAGSAYTDGVVAMNLWSTRTTDGSGNYVYDGSAQSQLVYIPVGTVPTPEPATLAVWAGMFGLAAALRLRRRTA